MVLPRGVGEALELAALMPIQRRVEAKEREDIADGVGEGEVGAVVGEVFLGEKSGLVGGGCARSRRGVEEEGAVAVDVGDDGIGGVGEGGKLADAPAIADDARGKLIDKPVGPHAGDSPFLAGSEKGIRI